MNIESSQLTIFIVLIILSLFSLIKYIVKKPILFANHLTFLWIFFFFFSIAEIISFSLGIWVLAILCFWSLREYFSLIDMRPEDRWAILGAYFSIPFMIYYIQINWYGMFIISIPVYTFLIIPFLLALGGKETQGIVFSTGAIYFGLFLFVYCLGHIGYLSFFSRRVAIMLIASIIICNMTLYFHQIKEKKVFKAMLFAYLTAMPVIVILAVFIAPWTRIPMEHSVTLGILIPFLILMGNFTIDHIESDLGIRKENILPGKGAILENFKSIFYTAPVVFHYIRYFLDEDKI